MKVDEEAEDKFSAQSTWKGAFMAVKKRIQDLRGQDSVETKLFYGHTARVFALCYRDNYLVTGTVCFDVPWSQRFSFAAKRRGKREKEAARENLW